MHMGSLAPPPRVAQLAPAVLRLHPLPIIKLLHENKLSAVSPFRNQTLKGTKCVIPVRVHTLITSQDKGGDV